MFQKSPVEDQKGTEKPNHVFFSTKYTWVFDLPSLDSKSPGMFMFHPRWCPNVINCFINPMNTIDISHIYHLYITYISPIYHLYITNKNNSEIGVILHHLCGGFPRHGLLFSPRNRDKLATRLGSRDAARWLSAKSVPLPLRLANSRMLAPERSCWRWFWCFFF